MKAICVFSGGLDSILAAELIRAQNIDVLALFFETPFFTSEKARVSARAINLPFKTIDITERHLDVVKNPPHGYGGNMNPCIDCHALMFRIAGEIMAAEGACFVFSGEVMGQRPMSQNKKSLTLIAAESGLEGLLLRPLSAKCLSPTIPEEKGWVSRDLLKGFQGRSRKPQMQLAQEMNIKHYPSPAGGCMLTEKGFSRRLRDLLTFNPVASRNDLEVLKLGRHFRLSPNTKIVVGRNKRENEKLRKLAKKDDLLLNTVAIPGPSVLVSGKPPAEMLQKAAQITLSYSDIRAGENGEVNVSGSAMDKRIIEKVPEKKDFKTLMI